MSESRFQTEALEHHRGRDGMGPVFGPESESGPPRRNPSEWAAASVGALRDLGRRRIAVCFQTQVSDCGAACLVMALRHHGVDVGLEQIRARINAGRNGASARVLLSLAREFGLTSRGVRTDVDGLRRLAPGTILFWNFNHFVVLERATQRYVDIADPAFGHRRLPRGEAAKCFTGVALEFEAPLGTRRRPLSGSGDGAHNPWRQLRHFLPGGRELLGLGALSTVLMGFEFVLPLTLSHVVGQVVAHRVQQALWLTAAVVGLAASVFLVTQLTRAFVLTRRQSLIEKRMTWGVIEHMMSLPYGFFTQHNSGDLAMRVRTSSTLNQVLSLSALSAVFDSLLIATYLVAILVANPALAGVVIALIAAQVAVLALTWRRQVQLSHEVLERQTRTQNELVELLESITTLKAAGVEDTAAERWSHTLVHEVNKRLGARRSLSVATAVSRTLQFSAPLVVLLIGVLRVLSDRDSLGGVLAFMALTTALFAPLESVFDTAAQLAAVRPALARLGEVLRAEPEPAGSPVVPPRSGRAAAIRLEKVSFTYRGATRPALRDADLTVRPGGFTAVLGRSGSGKSTLGMLLAGLYAPDSGTVRFDGTDVATLDRRGFRRQIGYINQNAQLFGASIRDNISFGAADVSHEDLVEAVRLARVHEEIIALPMGYETLVTPGGHGLSGGQRQRIVLARALARKPRLLILDEATSALDPSLEEEILQGLLAAGITVVAIAHRLTVLERADHVVVVRDGRIVESGSPADLRDAGGEFLCLA